MSSEEINEIESLKNTEFHKMFNFKDKEFAQDAVVSTPDNITKNYPDQLAIVIVIDIASTTYILSTNSLTHTKRK